MTGTPVHAQAGPEVDAVRADDLRDLASIDGPGCVSMFLPTARHGVETRQGPVRLRNLLGQARDRLTAAAEPVDAGEVLAPLEALVDDGDFWQHQSDGLALFAWPGGHRSLRVPLALDEAVHVGSRLRLRPLLPLTVASGRFHVLAVSQKHVRLFTGTEAGLTELDPGPMPTSLDEALAHEDHERELQFRSGGGGSAMFHGHGAGEEVDKATVERFLRAVDRGLTERVGADAVPLVLAGVGYHGPIYRSVTDRHGVLDAMVEGSPDHLSAADLHAKAWPIVGPVLQADQAALLERVLAGLGSGATVTEPAEVAERAGEGRVDTLLVATGPIDDPTVEDALDRAVAAALATSAAVQPVDRADLPGAALAAALLRY